MSADGRRLHVTTFCCKCHCGCVELFLEPDAPEHQQVVLTDDFGQRIQMSHAQLNGLIRHAKSGALEEALAAVP